MKATVVTIEYRSANHVPKLRDDGDGYEYALLGLYVVAFDDGFTAAIPHQGWPETVSATPLDPEVPEHRSIIVESACTMKEEYDEQHRGEEA